MSNKIWISAYFIEHNVSRSAKENKDALKIRTKINSFEDEYDMQKWLSIRRESSYNRQEDFNLFGISTSDEIDTNYIHKHNEFYKEQQFKNVDYQKRDIHDNLKYNKDGSVSEYGNLGKKMINFSNNTGVNKKNIMFIVENIKTILITGLVILSIMVILTLIVYLSGVANSVGHTPFVLCGENDINNKSVTKLPDAEAALMATPEYMGQAFVYVAKQKGWTDQATIGVLSYILQEGSGMGTFTYESYFCANGPSGVIADKTLDNKAWLTWLNGAGLAWAHSDYGGGYYAAIGLGLVQSSDVWLSSTEKEATNATNMIEAAEALGKPWQDPVTQLTYYFDTIFSGSTAFDTSGVDPTKDSRSAEEWCRRITAGVGMPAYSYTDSGSYMQDHIKHLEEATAIFTSSTGSAPGSLGMTKSSGDCDSAKTQTTGGNATLADAAVTLAGAADAKIIFDMHGESSPNLQRPSLATYKSVHIAIFPGDMYFASCDRGVATAVRWSGVDDTFPVGATGTQYSYMSSSPKWESVGMYSTAVLQPGDVMVTPGGGHIKMYVGNEAIKKKFPESNGNMYAASLEDYFPYVYADTPSYDGNYAVFRVKTPDNSKQYTSLK